MEPEWIRVDKRLPLTDKPVRVLWSPSSQTDRKTAIWDGAYWWTARRAGIYDEAPAYWLEVPPIPPHPIQVNQ